MKKHNKSQSAKNKENMPEKNDMKKLNAKFYNNPLMSSSVIIKHMHKKINMEITDVVEGLLEERGRWNGNNTKPIEEMLMAQAYALQAIFEKAASNIAYAEGLNCLQAWGVIAMKAQNQCRQTLATLADIKNPRNTATFIKQQNNAVNQQVNNNETQKNLGTEKNELLETQYGERLDTRTTDATISTHSQLEAVEKIHRSKNSRGQGYQ